MNNQTHSPPKDTLYDPATFNFADERLTRHQAAKYLDMTEAFLEADAIRKKHGIPYIKVGSRVFYLRSDLNRWVLENRHVA